VTVSPSSVALVSDFCLGEGVVDDALRRLDSRRPPPQATRPARTVGPRAAEVVHCMGSKKVSS